MGSTPRYREIADDLREAILNEEVVLDVQLARGARLPTEPELAEHFAVSRGTVREALKALGAEGLIETRGRRGTYVRRLRVLVHRADAERPGSQGAVDVWVSEVTAVGGVASQDFSFAIVAAPAAVAGHLGVEVDDLVVMRECLRYVDGIAWTLQVSWYPHDVAVRAKLTTPRDIREGTLRRLAGAGFEEVGWADEVSCRQATQDEARTFDLPAGLSVIVRQRVGWTPERPVRLTREVMPADRNVLAYRSGDLSGMEKLA